MVEQIHHAAKVIRSGGIVAFPTETSYGLAVDPFNEMALKKLYKLKQRPSDKPLLLLVCDEEQFRKCVSGVPPQYGLLIEKYWPGPLTMIFPANDDLPELLKKKDGVAVRFTSSNLAQTFLHECGIPLTATSANFSGGSPLVSAIECRELFKKSDVYVIDAPHVGKREFSTIIGIVNGKIKVLRAGVIDLNQDVEIINKRSDVWNGTESKP
ncbi:MAG: L-threonylcarbamoyladenylate synthase [Desulfotalea sp.]